MFTHIIKFYIKIGNNYIYIEDPTDDLYRVLCEYS